MTAPITAADSASAAHRDFVGVLFDGNFVFEVARVKVEWSARMDPGPDLGRLTVRPVHTFEAEVLAALFRAVADGSLDHGMTTDRDEVGPGQEAPDRLHTVRAYRGEPDWFSVAVDARGQPIGYVVPCSIEDDIAAIGEIGVAAGHRRRGYANDLLARATRQLIAHGAERFFADTDIANCPMRAAFATGGFREVRWRDDYRWRRQGVVRPPSLRAPSPG